MPTPGRHTYGYPRSRRLRGKLEIARVCDGRVRESRGPLTVLALPNDLGHSRIGLSVPKRVGSAPMRNRVKRMLRESFRLMQHDFPAGYDLMVVVRPHEAMILAEYQKLLMALVIKLHNRLSRAAPRSPRTAEADGYEKPPDAVHD